MRSKGLDGAIQPLFGRSWRDSKEHGNLVMRVPLDHLEDDDRAQTIRQCVNGLAQSQLVIQGGHGGLVWHVGLELTLTPSLPNANTGESDTCRHAPQPGVELAALVVMLESLGQPEEYIMNDVFGILPRAGETLRERSKATGKAVV